MCVSEFLEDVTSDSEAHKEVLDIVTNSQLDKQFNSKWKAAKIQLIKNKNLHSDYEGNGNRMMYLSRKIRLPWIVVHWFCGLCV